MLNNPIKKDSSDELSIKYTLDVLHESICKLTYVTGEQLITNATNNPREDDWAICQSRCNIPWNTLYAYLLYYKVEYLNVNLDDLFVDYTLHNTFRGTDYHLYPSEIRKYILLLQVFSNFECFESFVNSFKPSDLASLKLDEEFVEKILNSKNFNEYYFGERVKDKNFFFLEFIYDNFNIYKEDILYTYAHKVKFETIADKHRILNDGIKYIKNSYDYNTSGYIINKEMLSDNFLYNIKHILPHCKIYKLLYDLYIVKRKDIDYYSCLYTIKTELTQQEQLSLYDLLYFNDGFDKILYDYFSKVRMKMINTFKNIYV